MHVRQNDDREFKNTREICGSEDINYKRLKMFFGKTILLIHLIIKVPVRSHMYTEVESVANENCPNLCILSGIILN